MYAKRVIILILFCLSCQERPTKELYEFFDQFKYIQEMKINPFFLQKKPKYLPNDQEKWVLQYKRFDQKIFCLFIKLYRDQNKIYLRYISFGEKGCNSPRGKKIGDWSVFQDYGFIGVQRVKDFIKINFKKGQKVVTVNLEEGIMHDLNQNGLLLDRKMAEYLKNSPKLKKGEYCLKYNDDCKEIISNKCFSCEGTWSYRLEGLCKEKLNKVCGNYSCGALNQPACLRGQKNANYQGKLCQKNSPFGLCHKGLKVHCEGDKLVCRNY